MYQFISHINLDGMQFRSEDFCSIRPCTHTNQNEIWQRISLQIPNIKFNWNQVKGVGNNTCGQTIKQAHNAYIVW